MSPAGYTESAAGLSEPAHRLPVRRRYHEDSNVGDKLVTEHYD